MLLSLLFVNHFLLVYVMQAAVTLITESSVWDKKYLDRLSQNLRRMMTVQKMKCR